MRSIFICFLKLLKSDSEAFDVRNNEMKVVVYVHISILVPKRVHTHVSDCLIN